MLPIFSHSKQEPLSGRAVMQGMQMKFQVYIGK